MSDDLLAVRRAKLERLRADGIDPFPHAYPGVTPIGVVRAAHADLDPGTDTEVVQVGNAVTVKFDKGKPQTFTIVGSAEADPPHRLSNVSPVGKALMGRRKGEEVTINLPNGSTRTAKITKIDVGL